MFANLNLLNFTWKREPVLYIALAVALLNIVSSWFDGGLVAVDALESGFALVWGFFTRGQVSPA